MTSSWQCHVIVITVTCHYYIGVAAIYIGGYKSPPMFRYAQNVPPNKSLGLGYSNSIFLWVVEHLGFPWSTLRSLNASLHKVRAAHPNNSIRFHLQLLQPMRIWLFGLASQWDRSMIWFVPARAARWRWLVTRLHWSSTVFFTWPRNQKHKQQQMSGVLLSKTQVSYEAFDSVSQILWVVVASLASSIISYVLPM